MNCYLFAGADAHYDTSAYAFMVGSFPIQSCRHVGWTVTEAYLHGYLALSTYVIQNNIFKPGSTFTVFTASQQVITLINTDRLEVLFHNHWKDPSGPLFYVPILQELYYHRMFYKERKVYWNVLSEATESEFRSFEICQNVVKSIFES